MPAVKANAVYEGTYLMGTSLARPLIGRRMAEIAMEVGADDDKADAENQKKKPTGKRTANTKKRTSNGLKTTDRNFIL